MNSTVLLVIVFAVPTAICGIRAWFEWRQNRPDKVRYTAGLWLVMMVTLVLGWLFLPPLFRGPSLLGHSEAIERLRFTLGVGNLIFALAVLGVLVYWRFSVSNMPSRMQPYFNAARVVLLVSLLVTIFVVNR
jgi:hypothetical protein